MKNILIVDDLRFIRESTANVLVSLGVPSQFIHQCGSGESAKALLAQMPIDVIIADLQMADGDGFQLLEYLKKIAFRGAVIISSALDSDLINQSLIIAESVGINLIGAFQKPLQREVIQRALKTNFYETNSSYEAHIESFTKLDIRAIVMADESYDIVDTPYVVHYQPKLNLNTGAISGYEALARLQHQEKGVMPPLAFMSLVEETRMFDFSVLLLKLVIKDIDSKTEVFSRFRTVSINMPATLLANQRFVDYVIKNVDEKYTKKIAIEITETENVDDTAAFMIATSRLKMAGFYLSIDDFGAGYSDFQRLSEIPFDEIKIDKAYIIDILRNEKHHKLVKGIVQLAKTMNVNVVAEGVETKKILDELVDIGVEEVQGFYISPPLNTLLLRKWLKKQ